MLFFTLIYSSLLFRRYEFWSFNAKEFDYETKTPFADDLPIELKDLTSKARNQPVGIVFNKPSYLRIFCNHSKHTFCLVRVQRPFDH